MAKFGNMETITLSRPKISAFLNCQRQFQLRYLKQIAWPLPPMSDEIETAVSKGNRFHQLIEQHLNDLPISTQDPHLKQWWSRFTSYLEKLPSGERLIETTLTIPIETQAPTKRSYLLNGRFDLLIIGQKEDGTPFAHLYDWKTGRPKTVAELKQDWQTRLYLAMLTEGGAALLPKGSAPLKPSDISFTYWYVDEPDDPRTIQYSEPFHAENWADIQNIVHQIDALSTDEIWTLTEDLEQCRTCAFTIICQRQGKATAVSLFDEDEPLPTLPDQLEPERP